MDEREKKQKMYYYDKIAAFNIYGEAMTSFADHNV